MTIQFITTRLHGYLDYLTAALLPILPRALRADTPVTRLCDATACVTSAYSTLTDYELGIVKVLPMKTHLTLDAVGGAAWLTAAVVMNDESRAVRGTMAGVGLFFLATALCTRTGPATRRMARTTASPIARYARETGPEAAIAVPT